VGDGKVDTGHTNVRQGDRSSQQDEGQERLAAQGRDGEQGGQDGHEESNSHE
jgi:hypothetical protein